METHRNKQLAEKAKTTPSQIDRIIKCDVGLSIDGLELLATAFRCQPRDLLTPYFRVGTDQDVLSDTGVNRVLKADKLETNFASKET